MSPTPLASDCSPVSRPSRSTSARSRNCSREPSPLAQDEAGTTLWFALRLGPTTFGIFDAFGTEEDRSAHLQGHIAAALMDNAPKLLAEAPEILPVEVLAAKLS